MTIPPEFKPRWFPAATTRGEIKRRVFRRTDTGPTVILIHEAPTISASTFRIAKRLSDERYTVVIPELIPPTAIRSNKIRMAVGFAQLCVAREMAGFSAGRTGAIVEWLRELAKAESTDSGGRSVAVIGMCFSGGFALGAILESSVSAAVLSQPSLPYPIWFGRSSDLGVSGDDLAGIKRKVGDGGCIRVLRYSRDRISPSDRFCRVVREFPEAEHREVPSAAWTDHSVLADGANAAAGSDLEKAFSGTLSFLKTHLPGV